MALRGVAACLVVLAALFGSACDNKPPAPPPDRDQLYRLFERAADFAVALDRLDVICTTTSPGGRVDWVTAQGTAMLDADQQAKLAAFIADRKDAIYENYKKDYCGMEISTERDNFITAYKVHRARLEVAIQKVKDARR
jgi:hypothetical protein